MTDPKPPAASGDRFDEQAERTLDEWRDAAFDKSFAECIAAALRQAAKEAQGRALEAYAKEAKSLDGDLVWQLYTRIEKEGPL